MPVANTPEQNAMLRLERIQQEIVNQLNIGSLDANRRGEAARQVVALRQEADAIAANPHDYQHPEPWQIADPERRQELTALTVKTVFSAAPEDDILTEALISWWIGSLSNTASRQNQREYNKECRRMRAEADIARRQRAEACPYKLPDPPTDPGPFLHQMQELIAQTRQQISQNRKQPSEPWRRAAVYALDELDADAGWLLHNIPPELRSGNRAHSAQCLELAQRFNEIYYASERR